MLCKNNFLNNSVIKLFLVSQSLFLYKLLYICKKIYIIIFFRNKEKVDSKLTEKNNSEIKESKDDNDFTVKDITISEETSKQSPDDTILR